MILIYPCGPPALYDGQWERFRTAFLHHLHQNITYETTWKFAFPKGKEKNIKGLLSAGKYEEKLAQGDSLIPDADPRNQLLTQVELPYFLKKLDDFKSKYYFDAEIKKHKINKSSLRRAAKVGAWFSALWNVTRSYLSAKRWNRKPCAHHKPFFWRGSFANKSVARLGAPRTPAF